MVKSYLPAIAQASTPPVDSVPSKDAKETGDTVKQPEVEEYEEEEVPFYLKLQFVDKLRLISPPSMKALV